MFGHPLKDFVTVEGNYTFHFEATYGEGCTAKRELRWSLHVDVGIDPGSSSVTTSFSGGKGTITLFRAIAMAIKWARDWPAVLLLAAHRERLCQDPCAISAMAPTPCPSCGTLLPARARFGDQSARTRAGVGQRSNARRQRSRLGVALALLDHVRYCVAFVLALDFVAGCSAQTADAARR